MRRRPASAKTLGVVVALALLVAAPGAGAANPSVNVVFSASGAITALLPGGAPFGAATGAPPVVAAGWYTLALAGPGGPDELPYFELTGPGVNVLDGMQIGEVKETVDIHLLPSSTYTWRDLQFPDVVYTLRTSTDVVGSPPPQRPADKATSSSQDVVGSALQLRGTLVGTVAAGGSVSLAHSGALAAGRYRVKVTDRSPRAGFVLVKGGSRLVVTGARFVGSRVATLTLSAGRWSARSA